MDARERYFRRKGGNRVFEGVLYFCLMLEWRRKKRERDETFSDRCWRGGITWVTGEGRKKDDG